MRDIKTYRNEEKTQEELQGARKLYENAHKYVTSITFRAPNPHDLTFVYDAWAKSSSVDVPYEKYKEHNQRIGERLTALLKSGAEIVLAVDETDESHTLGFIIFTDRDDIQEPILHYAYVKQKCRNQGIMKQMLRLVGFSLNNPIKTTTWVRRLNNYLNKPYRFEFIGGK
jgi:hypothetical protein